MYKPIPGSLIYRINKNLDIIDQFGNHVDLSINKSKFQIELFGESKILDKTFVMLLAWYECGYIPDLANQLENIEFTSMPYNALKLHSGYIMHFKEPVWFNKEYRYIPSFTRYAINKEGTIIDTVKHVVVPSKQLSDGYCSALIWMPDKNKIYNVKLHRLIALAWIPNSDFRTRPYINHIDGNKANNVISNLEWCSMQENTVHAILTHLNDCAVGMKCRDIYTGEVKYFPTQTELFKYITNNPNSKNLSKNFNLKLPGYLYSDRYEVKYTDDNSPWFYEQNVDPTFKGKAFNIIKVRNRETGIETLFNKLSGLRKSLGLKFYTGNKDSCGGIADTVNYIARKYKDKYDITLVTNIPRVTYYIYRYDTKELVSTCSSLAEAGREIGITKPQLQADLFAKKKYIYRSRYQDGAIVTTSSDDPNYDEYVVKPYVNTKIEVFNTINNEVVVYDSLRKCAYELKCARKTLRNHIETKKPFNHMLIRPVVE